MNEHDAKKISRRTALAGLGAVLGAGAGAVVACGTPTWAAPPAPAATLPPVPRGAKPSIDTVRHARLQTATFALG